MATRPHRRYSAEFKLRLVEAYLGGDRSAKSLADEHGIAHSLILAWAAKFRKGELTPEIQREEEIRDRRAAIAGLERKLGQLRTELATLKNGAPRAIGRRAASRRS